MDHYLIGSAIVPSVLLVWFFHKRDRFPEPAPVLWGTFALGVLTVLPVLLVVVPFAGDMEAISDPFQQAGIKAFVGAAIPEEFFKFLVVVLFCSRHREFDEPMDGIVYGVVASLGFATLENILYVSDGGYRVALLRAFTAVPGHALTGAIMGYFVGQARFSPAGGNRNWILALLIPILLHGLYDFPLMAVAAYSEQNEGEVGAVGLLLLVVLVVMIYEWVFTIRRMRILRKEQDAKVAVGGLATAGLRSPAQTATTPETATPEPRGGKLAGGLFTLVGASFAAVGGLMAIGLTINQVESVEETEIMALIIAYALAAALPLYVGLRLFRAGLRRLNG